MSPEVRSSLHTSASPATISRRTTGMTALKGRCATLGGLDTRAFLAELGPGEALPAHFRESMGAALGADLADVRLHRHRAADRLTGYLGAEAFALHQHIAFARGRYQPHSLLGWALLGHELAHTLEPHGPLRAWLTFRCQATMFDKLHYSVGGFSGHLFVGPDTPNSHRYLTTGALRKVGGFGLRAWEHILYWNEEVDVNEYKNSMPTLIAKGFPELRNCHVGHVHSFPLGGSRPGVQAREMGFTSNEAASASLIFNGEGVIIKLLDAAARNANAGHLDHAFHLLGISLHMIQDYFSHNVPLHVAERPGQNLRVALAKDPNFAAGFWILEDDPKWDPARFQNAQRRSEDQLREFRRRLSGDHPPDVWKLRG